MILLSFISMLVFYAILFYIQYRTKKAHQFMKRNIELCYDWSMNHIREIVEGKEQSAFDWFYPKQPPLNKLVFSYRPITLDEWFDKKDLAKLFN